MKKTMLIRMLSLNVDYSRRVFGLDLLRALAITLVVVEHSIVLLRPFPISLDKICWSFGFWGVELFFVLSGFLIGSIIIKSFDREGFCRMTLLNFWRRRWYRTLPNYYLFLFVNVLVGWLVWEKFDFTYMKYPFFLQNLYSPHPSFFGEAWTLALEEWFYLLLPLCIYFLSTLFPKGEKRKIILSAIGFVIFMSILLRYGQFIRYPGTDLGVWDTFFRKIVFLRLDSIMFGVVGAYMMYHHRRFLERYGNFLFMLGLGIILFDYLFSRSFIELGLAGPFSKTLFFTFCGLGLLLILPRCHEIKIPRSRLYQLITQTSVLSYSLYLIHYSFLLKLFKAYFTVEGAMEAVGVYLLYWFVLVLLALVVYKYFEKPIMDLRDKSDRIWSQVGFAGKNT